MKRLGITAPAKIGACAFCMQSALLSAVALGGAAALAAVLSFGILAAGLSFAALAFSLLWLAHVVGFAIRLARRQETSAGGTIDSQRRRLLQRFARGLGVAGALTVLPLRVAFAKCCTHTYFCLDKDGKAPCCPDGSDFLCHEDCKCYASVPSSCKSYSQCTD